MLVNYNGKVCSANAVNVSIDNRGLKYGDGLFETIRMFDGQLPFLALHINRLKRGMDILGLDTTLCTTSFFKKEISKIPIDYTNGRYRIGVFREIGGLYTAPQNNWVFFIEVKPLPERKWQWQKNGLEIDYYPTPLLSNTILSGLKTSNALPYVLAATWAKKQGLDDCLILNHNLHIGEASSSNIFIIRNKHIYSTDNQQGAIEGTMQNIVLNTLSENDIPFTRTPLSKSDIESADEIFLTNAISGIRWVKNIGQKTYHCDFSHKIYLLLIQKLATTLQS